MAQTMKHSINVAELGSKEEKRCLRKLKELKTQCKDKVWRVLDLFIFYFNWFWRLKTARKFKFDFETNTNCFWAATNCVIKYLTGTLSLNCWRHGSKTKLFKYQRADAKEKFIRDQTQNPGIYQGSKTYLSLLLLIIQWVVELLCLTL